MSLDELSLARRLEAAEAARYTGYAHARAQVLPGLLPAVFPACGGRAVFAGIGSPYSRAVGLGLAGSVAESELEAVEAFYRDREAAARLNLCPLADRSLISLLAERPYGLEMFMQVWQRELRRDVQMPPPPAGVSVRPIQSEEADLWTRVALQGFLESEEAGPDRSAIIAAYPYMAGTTCFLGWVGGQPAGAATLAVHEGVATLFGDSTRVPFRGQGVQYALLLARLAAAALAGCDLATAHTEPGSAAQRNIGRLGFRLAYTKVMMGRVERTP